MSESDFSFWAEQSMQAPLSENEKRLRERFVEQYMQDFNVRGAAMRMGFVETVALDFGMKLLNDPYSQQLISLAQSAEPVDEKTEESETKRKIRALLLKEANYHGPGSSHSARVSALAKLSAFYGMDAPVKSKIDITHQGGVMAVPGIASVDDWEKQAEATQEQLVRDTNDG